MFSTERADGFPTLVAIERQIVARLAEHRDCDAGELYDELRSADRDLPVDSDELRAVLGLLELDFDVELPDDGTLGAGLDYVHDLALLIQKRRLAALR